MSIFLHWLASIGFAQLWMLIAWLTYRYIGNPMLADIAWGLGITLLGWIHVWFHGTPSLQQAFMLGLLTLWGLRLSFYLYWTRLRQHWHDKRYQDLEDKDHNLFINYQIQGLLQFLIAIPWFFIGQKTHTFTLVLSTLVFAFGFAIECLSDHQLQLFKKNPNSKVCNVELWQYSRHPNYFGECCIWLSFAIAGFSSLWGILSFISPISLYLIMSKITGPLTEASSIKSRGTAYLNYQKITPMIIPDFKKLWRS